jgi:hypothetical protein
MNGCLFDQAEIPLHLWQIVKGLTDLNGYQHDPNRRASFSESKGRI